MVVQKVLDDGQLIHEAVQLVLAGSAHPVADGVHLCFQIKKIVEGGGENLTDGGAAFQTGMLIQIAHLHMVGPQDSAFVRLQLAGNDMHKGGFSLAVGSHQADVFACQQAEGNILKNSSVAKAVGKMFNS